MQGHIQAFCLTSVYVCKIEFLVEQRVLACRKCRWESKMALWVPLVGSWGKAPGSFPCFGEQTCWNSSFMASFFRIDSLFFEFESFLHFWDCSWSFKDLPPPTPSPFMKILWFTRLYPLLLRSFNDLPESLPLSSAALYK